MITAAADPAVRVAVDSAIDTALTRLRERAQDFGGGFAALGDAIGRAAAGGKRLRPALVVAAFEALGGDRDRTPAVLDVAAAFELLHTAFVVHDDVIDHDTHRRGIPNIAGEFRARGRARGADAAGAALLGDAAAILAGDLLLHEAARLIAAADVAADVRVRLLALLDDALMVSAAGELADVENAVTGADADAILAATRDKTAVYSFSAPLRAGAVLATADAATEAALDRCGAALGLAFQLVDDLIGAFGSVEAAGRSSGGDLREAKQTPLVAMARESADWTRVSDALAAAHTGPIAVRDAQRALQASGAPTRVVALVEDALADARHEADGLPAPARELIGETAARIRERVP